MPNKICAGVIGILLLLSLQLFPQDSDPKPQIRRALEKSLLFPGWGQIYEKQYVKGLLFMTAEGFCIVQSIIYNSKANQFYEKYKLADNSHDAAQYRNDTEKFDRRRNIYMLAGAAVWVANLLDIYLFTKKKYKKKGVKFFLKHDEGNKISFGFNFYF